MIVSSQRLTARPHLTASRQHRLQHLADLNVAQPPSHGTTHALLNDRHDSEDNSFVRRCVASVELAVCDGMAQLCQDHVYVGIVIR